MLVHDLYAIKRNIIFVENIRVDMDIHASDNCCWNCRWSNMTYDGLWCERDMDEVDRRDLCFVWKGGPGPEKLL
jgi:hypothetical protein